MLYGKIYIKPIPKRAVVLFSDVIIDNQTETFIQIKNEEYEPGFYTMEYKGVLPGTTKEAILNLALDSKNNNIIQYDISFVKYNSAVGYYCEPTKPEYKGTQWISQKL